MSRYQHSSRPSLKPCALARVAACAALLMGMATGLPAQDAAPEVARPTLELTEAALEIHHSATLMDGHNDLPWKLRQEGFSSLEGIDLRQRLSDTKLETDVPRLREGGVKAQFWSAYVPVDTMRSGTAVRETLEQIDLIHRFHQQYNDIFEMADTVDEIERITREGKIAGMIGIEGGHSIDESLAVLRVYYELGARYMTLTHSDTLSWADSATDQQQHGGLTSFGLEVIREMNRLGMLVDISHVSPDTMRTALRVSQAPVIASHSSAYAVAEHPRNVPDDVLDMVRQNGGVVMVNFFSGFVVPESARIMADMFQVRRDMIKQHGNNTEAVTEAMKQWYREHPMPAGGVQDVVDHIDHIVRAAGIDHVGLGSDFDGVSQLPAQLTDVSCYPYITQELVRRGYSADDIRKILGGNVLRALRQAEQVAADWPR